MTIADLRADVVVVGGGVAGCSATTSLMGNGLRILLLEKSDRLGGRAQSDLDARTQDRVDIGPHVVTRHHYNFMRLLETLGTASQIVWQGAPLMTLFTPPRGFDVQIQSLPPPLHLAVTGLRAPGLSLLDKLSNIRAGLLAMSIDADQLRSLDSVSVETMLVRLGVSARSRQWLWQSLSMTLLNGPSAQVSAGALMRIVRQALGHRDVGIGFPAIALDELFAVPLRAHLGRDGGEIVLNCAVEGMSSSQNGAIAVHLDDGRRVLTSACVVAVEPQAMPGLLPPAALEHDLIHGLRALPRSEYCSVMLWFDRKVTTKRIWGRMYTPAGLNYDFYDLSNIRPAWLDRPSVIASNIIYSQRLGDRDDETIVRQTLRELIALIPDAAGARLIHRRVHRTPMAIPIAVPGTESTRLPCVTAVPHLYLANDWCRTGLPACMESAARAGFLAAQALATQRGWRYLAPVEVPEPGGLCRGLRRLVPNIGLRSALGPTAPSVR